MTITSADQQVNLFLPIKKARVKDCSSTLALYRIICEFICLSKNRKAGHHSQNETILQCCPVLYKGHIDRLTPCMWMLIKILALFLCVKMFVTHPCVWKVRCSSHLSQPPTISQTERQPSWERENSKYLAASMSLLISRQRGSRMASQASFQPETTMPRFYAGLHEGSVIIPNQGHGLRSDAVCCSVRRKVYRSLLFGGHGALTRQLILSAWLGFPLESDIHLSRYNCQRTTEASRPLTYYINIIMLIFDFVNICFIRNFASVFSNYLQGVLPYSNDAETS